MTKEGWYCGYSAAVSQDMTVSENLSKEILIGNAAFGISYRLICTPYSGTAGMLLVDFLSKIHPFIPYDVTVITLFYFVDFNYY